MRSRAAILRTYGGPWSVEEFELAPPRAGEVLVRMAAAGLCHSDEHIRQGHLAPPAQSAPTAPTIGGHEGSGVVVQVGDGVTGPSPGDHVVTSFVAVCGQCHWCSSGMEYICDAGAGTMLPGMPTDGTFRHHGCDGRDLAHVSKIGAFAEHTVVSAASVRGTRTRVDPQDLMLMNKTLCGTVFGSCNPRTDIPLLATLYEAGRLHLDEMVTKCYQLDDINQAYEDLAGGELIRGIIDFGL